MLVLVIGTTYVTTTTTCTMSAYAAARKAEYKVLFDNTGVVEEKMVQSRVWMDERIYGNKQKKDIETACASVWARMMHVW